MKQIKYVLLAGIVLASGVLFVNRALQGGYEQVYEQDDLCSVCWEDIGDPRYLVELECGHVFHYDCIYRWFQGAGSRDDFIVCPLCRGTVKIKVDTSYGPVQFFIFKQKYPDAALRFFEQFSESEEQGLHYLDNAYNLLKSFEGTSLEEDAQCVWNKFLKEKNDEGLTVRRLARERRTIGTAGWKDYCAMQ